MKREILCFMTCCLMFGALENTALASEASIISVQEDKDGSDIQGEDALTIEAEEVLSASVVDSWDNMADISWYNNNSETFEISTPQQLAGVAKLVNDGNTFEGKTINLIEDIYLNGENYEYEWTSIGRYGEDESGRAFQGTFHGNAHTIYNMLTTSENKGGGLFGWIGEKGIVKAVNISQGYLEAEGSIACVNEGIIAFCHNYSDISGNKVGGICGMNYNLIYGCKNYGDVLGESDGAGIASWNAEQLAVVSQCSNWGNVESESSGGIVSWNYGWIYNCYNKGAVSGPVWGAGGMAAITGSPIANCYSTGDVSGRWGETGAIHGGATEKVYNCYVLSEVGHMDNVSLVTLEEMQSNEFVEKLDKQKYTVLSAWLPDTLRINEGLPITIAEYCYENGIYKIQPELWLPQGKELLFDEDNDAYEYKISCYYNEEAPVVTVENDKVATVSYVGGIIYIDTLRRGTTYINIHFNETENNISADHKVKLTVKAPELEQYTGLFSDIAEDENNWQYISARYVYQKGLMTGKGTNVDGGVIFEPEEMLTREQFAQILYSAEGKPEVTYLETFDDIPEGKWYTSAVLWAADKGIVSGYGNGSYGVSDSITREQLAAMLYKYAEYKGYDTTARASFDKFTDQDQISTWATGRLQWAVANGVMSGKGELLDPIGSATRSECAAMLRTFMMKFAEE